MTGNRAFRVAATSARVITGVAVAVAAVVGVSTAIHTPWPEVRHEPAQVDVTPLPGDTVLVCNGDLRALGRDSSAPLDMRSAAAPSLTDAGTSGDPAVRTLDAPDLIDAGEVRVLTGAVEGRTAPMVAAAESVSVTADDLAGFAALPCGVPRLESWLVGGSVGTGTEDIVVLTNAGAVPTTVTLSIFGTARSSRTIVVPAGTQLAVPLASVAAGNDSPVVQVSAVGAPVRAVLQSSLVRVLDPVGIDLQGALAGAQQNLVFPGVQAFAAEGDDAEMTIMRLLAPESDAQARIVVRAVDSGATATEFTVPLVAGMPSDVSLSGLAPGTYTVEVEADAAVVAAVRQQDGSGRESDYAWVTPAPEVDREVLLAVPAGPTPRLHVANTSDQAATVSITPVDGGEAEEAVVPPGESVLLDVTAQTTYRLQTTGVIHAAVTMTAPGALAVLPVEPGAGAEQAITVYP